MKTRRSRSKLDNTSPDELPANFPSARYFQVHFEYLHETIKDLKQQVDKANQQIAELHQQLQASELNDIATVTYAGDVQPTVNMRQS